jgi:hypothetical protein
VALNEENMKQIAIILTLIFLFGFTDKKEKDFARYYSAIRIISLPIVFDYRNNIEFSDTTKIDPNIYHKYCSQSSSIIGRIFPNEEFVSILYFTPKLDGMPIIITYTKSGYPIDTLNLFYGSDEDPNGGFHEFSKIKPDKVIQLFDTTYTVKPDSLGNPIAGTKSTYFHKVIYSLERDGHFKERSDLKRHLTRRSS